MRMGGRVWTWSSVSNKHPAENVYWKQISNSVTLKSELHNSAWRDTMILEKMLLLWIKDGWGL